MTGRERVTALLLGLTAGVSNHAAHGGHRPQTHRESDMVSPPWTMHAFPRGVATRRQHHAASSRCCSSGGPGRNRPLQLRLGAAARGGVPPVAGMDANLVAFTPALLIELPGVALAPLPRCTAAARCSAQDRALRLRSSRSFHIRNWGPRLARLGAPICASVRSISSLKMPSARVAPANPPAATP